MAVRQVYGCVLLMMRKITAIEAQKNNPQRVNIHMDGEFAFGLTRMVAAWLQVGQTLTEEKISALQVEDSQETAYQQALKFLSYRPRSLEEIRQNLRKHKVPQEVIESTLERLVQNGYASDTQFAKTWVENRNTFRPRSRRALLMELRQKGLSDEVIQGALDENMDDEILAYQAGSRQAQKMTSLDWPDFRRRLGGFLARRGFSYSTITPLLNRIWGDIHPGKSGDHSINEENI